MSRARSFLIVRSLDVAVILAYFAAVIVFGLALAGRQRDASDYFLGHRGLPWWALMFSVVATETSALTVISVPGLAARGNLTFLQIAFGYLLGRIGVAALLLPGYFEGTQDTAYQRLEHRFGPTARRAASGVAPMAPTASEVSAPTAAHPEIVTITRRSMRCTPRVKMRSSRRSATYALSTRIPPSASFNR